MGNKSKSVLGEVLEWAVLILISGVVVVALLGTFGIIDITNLSWFK